MKKYLFTLALTCLIPTLTYAKDAGYYELIENKTILNLSESAEKKVEQDRIRATLRFNHEAKDNQIVQNKINKAMQDAVNMAKKYRTVKVSTGRYNIHERYNNKLRVNEGWKGSQEIVLDSKNKDDLLKIVQNLQKNEFNMSNMNYYLSREKAASYRTELINEALKRVQQSAKSIATQLNAKHWHIGSIDVSSNNKSPSSHRNIAHMEMAMVKSADVAKPTVESSDERVNVTIRVAVILDMRE
jgi:predicted secreted protein